MKHLLIITITLMILIISSNSLIEAHPGRLRKKGPYKGCHKEKKTGKIHCHENGSLKEIDPKDRKKES